MTTNSEHKDFAVQSYGHCWELLGKERSPDDDRNLIGAALTSRYHWQIAGGPQEKAIADWMVGRAFAAVAEGQLSLNFANSAITHDDGNFPAWLKASLFEGIARAHRANGDLEARDIYVSKALIELKSEEDKEDADLIREQISDLA